MKLLLSSRGWEQNQKIAKKFLRLIGKPAEAKIFLITTARKKDRDWKWVRIHIDMLKDIGISKKNISIFSLDRKIEKDELITMDAVYVCGGNTFLYLSGIKKTGLDKEIKKFMKNGGVYYGISAGSVIAGPDISFVSALGDTNDIKLKNKKGLELTKLSIAPHYDNKKHKKVINGLIKKMGSSIVPLTDRQAVEVINEKTTIIR